LLNAHYLFSLEIWQKKRGYNSLVNNNYKTIPDIGENFGLINTNQWEMSLQLFQDVEPFSTLFQHGEVLSIYIMVGLPIIKLMATED
ncbi:hypothetical protein ACJX0J_022071, partial [Zea mays]